jgi:hypothetical protein
MAERNESTADFEDTQPGLERAKAIIGEFACATQSAALSLADEQKRRAAQQVDSVAEAVRSAARSLDRSQSPLAGRFFEQAAVEIEEFSRSLRERRWGELIGDIEEVARRRPTLFVLAAVAAGFLAGRFLSVSTQDDSARRPISEGALPPTEAVTAAVSSASGNGRLSSWRGENPEPRETL